MTATKTPKLQETSHQNVTYNSMIQTRLFSLLCLSKHPDKGLPISAPGNGALGSGENL